MSRKGITDKTRVVHRHLRLGGVLLLGFLSLGIILETLHAFKVDLYMNTENKTRRLLWTLAHAHGTLLAILTGPSTGQQDTWKTGTESKLPS